MSKFRVGSIIKYTGCSNEFVTKGYEYRVESFCQEAVWVINDNGGRGSIWKDSVELVEPNTIKENPSSITLKQNYELYIQGQTFSLSKSEFEQLKEQVNG